MKIIKDFSLDLMTTFKIGGKAEYYYVLKNKNELKDLVEFIKTKQLTVTILGGGSNILINDHGVSGLVIKIDLKGWEMLDETTIKIGAGENWDEVVSRVIDLNLWGTENMSYIPGLVGALPIQNVGAYGQESSQIIREVHTFNFETGKNQVFSNQKCRFNYRSSIFKNEYKDKLIITSVILKLSKNSQPNLGYPDLQNYFIKPPTLSAIREAIIKIRKSKIPEPKEYGNSGSFFKNIILTKKEFSNFINKIDQNFSLVIRDQVKTLCEKFHNEDKYKVSTALLIDICQLKDLAYGGAGIHPRSPLVIINKTGSAKATDILNLMKILRQTVFSKTGLIINPEPNIIGFTDQELEKYFDLKIVNHKLSHNRA